MAGSITTNVTLHIYVENDVTELARALGVVKPGGGWAGTEEIDLDPSFIADFKVDNYDGTDSASLLVFTEYLNEFQPNKLTMNLEAEGDVRIAEMSGTAVAYYIVPVAD